MRAKISIGPTYETFDVDLQGRTLAEMGQCLTDAAVQWVRDNAELIVNRSRVAVDTSKAKF